jgi:hypothetical protein
MLVRLPTLGEKECVMNEGGIVLPTWFAGLSTESN